jgi:hypothetical protein
MNDRDKEYIRDEVSLQIARLREPLEQDIKLAMNDLSGKYITLQTECHNFADEWTRKIEAIEQTILSGINPAMIRKELAALIADFVRLSK